MSVVIPKLFSAPMLQRLNCSRGYGYSGPAKPANSNANIAMYTAGGVAAGAVAGAGAMYAYNNMSLGAKWGAKGCASNMAIAMLGKFAEVL